MGRVDISSPYKPASCRAANNRSISVRKDRGKRSKGMYLLKGVTTPPLTRIALDAMPPT